MNSTRDNLSCLIVRSLRLANSGGWFPAMFIAAGMLIPSYEHATGQENGTAEKEPLTTPAEPTLTDPETPMLTPMGPLPWKSAPRVPGRDFESAREMYEILGVDASHWDKFFHDVAFNESEEESVLRLLLKMPKLGRDNIFRWRKATFDPAEAAAEPTAAQGEFYRIAGTAVKVHRVALNPELAQRYEFDHYYKVHAEIGEGKTPVAVYSRSVPLAWEKAESLAERFACDGLFLKASPPVAGEPSFHFAALRAEWNPAKDSQLPGVSAGWIFLGDHGYDCGQFELLDGLSRRISLQEEDSEPFYTLLGAMKNSNTTVPPLRDAPILAIEDAINHKTADSMHGRLFTIDGTVRRIRSIEISEEMRARVGYDRYYEMYIFVQIGAKRIQWSRGKDDKNPRIFENEFPVTVCVTKLPPELKPAEILHEHAIVRGVFYRLWNYRLEGEQKDLPQPSPMIIGGAVDYVPSKKVGDSPLSIALGCGAIALAAVGWFAVWRFGKDERSRRDAIKREQSSVSLKDFNPEIKSGPDFSKLEK